MDLRNNAQMPAGDWLFRQGEIILGPVPAAQIVDRLYSGELNAKTEVAPLGQSTFQSLASVEHFKIHVAKAEAKLRVDQQARDEQVRTGRRNALRIAAVVGVCLIVGAGAAWVARYAAVHASLSENVEEEALFEIEAPVIRLARARASDADELVYYPTAAGGMKMGALTPKGGSAPGPVASATASASKPGKTRPASSAASRPSGPRLSSATNDPDGMQTGEFDQAAINAVVAQKQKTLYPCLKAAMERKPDVGGKIPVEFVIGNDGKVAKLWIDHPDFKDGPLHACMLRELQKWPFRPYQGENATVGLAFKLSGKAR